MNLSEICGAFVRAESKYDLTSISWKGIELWPVFRHHAKLAFKEKEKYFGTAEPNRKNLTGLSGLKIFLSHHLKFRKQLSKYHPSQTDFLFLSKPVDYTETISTKSYNRFIDPLVDDLKKSNFSFSKFLLLTNPSQKSPDLFYPGSTISSFDFEIAWRVFHTPEGPDSDLEKHINFFEDVTGIKINHASFRYMIWRILCYEHYFEKLLKKLKPKAIFLVNYDNAEWFGLIKAAKKLGINTVDVQHGKQGPYNPPYSHWTTLPESGYKILPTFFWNWGNESATNITKWLPENSPHQTVVGGNRWLGKWKEGNFAEELSEEFKSLKKIAEGYKNVVLYSLQPIDNPIPDHLSEAILQGPKDILWLLRSHPRQGTDTWKSNLENLENVEIKISSNTPLYPLLTLCHAHITCWSSVAFEAKHFEVETLIIHETGKDIYGDTFKSAFNKTEILDWVNDQKKLSIDSNYILTNKATAMNAFKSIADHSKP